MKKKNYFFLDRDGTIIHHVKYLNKFSQIKLYTNTIKALEILNKYGKVFVITNQSSVARGLLTEKKLILINKRIIKIINKKKKLIQKIFYCPHHIDGIIGKYKKKCTFRKPDIGFIKKFKNINKKDSWFIGDTHTDIKAGIKSKLNTILLNSGTKYKKNTQINKLVIKCKNIYFAAKKIEKYFS